jgi:sulfur-carrier protein
MRWKWPCWRDDDAAATPGNGTPLAEACIDMQVLIPSALRSYTRRMYVDASGATLGEVFADLERQFPGIRFRMLDEQGQMRPHMRVFVDGQGRRDMAQPLPPGKDVNIVQALSGG